MIAGSAALFNVWDERG